jgi:hypothetical protein
MLILVNLPNVPRTCPATWACQPARLPGPLKGAGRPGMLKQGGHEQANLPGAHRRPRARACPERTALETELANASPAPVRTTSRPSRRAERAMIASARLDVAAPRRSEHRLAHNRRFGAIPSSFAAIRERVIHPYDQLSTVRDGGAASGSGRVPGPRPAADDRTRRVRSHAAPPWGSGRAIAPSRTPSSVAAPDPVSWGACAPAPITPTEGATP